MKKKFLAAVLAACLCLSACSERTTSNLEYNSGAGANPSSQSSTESFEEEKSNNSNTHNKAETLTPDTSANSSVGAGKVLVPLGVISGKRSGGSIVLPSEFVCTQPLSNCYQPKTGSDQFGITSISITIQDTRSPDEIIQCYDTRSGLGSASFYEIMQGNRKIRAYIIGEWDSNDTSRLLQPEERYYHHVLEFAEGPYFVSFVYTTKGIENKEAEEEMLRIIDTFQLEPSPEEKVARTFDLWSDFGTMAPTLFQRPEDLIVEDLRELYTYYCASTHTPVYDISEESGNWEESESYYKDNYAKVEELCAFGKNYFGQGDWDADAFHQIEDSSTDDPEMVLLSYESQQREKKRPKNWLNDVFLLNSSIQGDQIILQLRYFYTRMAAVPELESLDCTVTAKWVEDRPVFESCQITDIVPAHDLEQPFVRTKVQLPPDILSQVDQSDDTSIIDAVYLGLGLEEQGYVVYQEGQVAFTLYTQITDAGSKTMSIPDNVFPGYECISLTCSRADGSGKPNEDYLLSCTTGKIVALTEEETEIMIRGSTEGKESLIKELFQ